MVCGPKVAHELKFCGPQKGPDYGGLRAKILKIYKRKIVCCLLSLMTTPVHPHLVIALSKTALLHKQAL